MRGDLGRIHGSVGVAIQHPRLVVNASDSSETTVIGARSSRAIDILTTFLNDHNITSGIRLEISEDIPEHTGFGSGTQLTLALGTIISKMFNLGLTPQSIAERMGRSGVSGVGTYAFIGGGFIVDGGHSLDRREAVPPLIFRKDFPEDWVFVVGIPSINRGVSGVVEKEAFRRLAPPPAQTVAEVSRTVLIQMIPSLIEGDIEMFGDAMTKLDAMFGDYWLKVQGGRYSHPRIEAGVRYLLEHGALGAGQSSWGPAFYGLVDGEAHADELAKSLSQFLNIVGEGTAFTTKVDNVGAQIRVH